MSNRLIEAWKRLHAPLTEADWESRPLNGVRGNRVGAARMIMTHGGRVEPFTDDMRRMQDDLFPY